MSEVFLELNSEVSDRYSQHPTKTVNLSAFSAMSAIFGFYAFESRGFGGEIGVIQQEAPLKRGFLLDGRLVGAFQLLFGQFNIERNGTTDRMTYR